MLHIESQGPVVYLRLNRPQARNALNQALREALLRALTSLESHTRVVVLAGQGPVFSAGADIHEMKAWADRSDTDNLQDAQGLAHLFKTLDTLPFPVIGQVHGMALGGGVGLVACCDMVVSTDTTRFGFTETRLGLTPALIAPYVLAKIGAAAARRYFLTGETFGAPQAHALGLVHQVVASEKLASTVEKWIETILTCGPCAVAQSKHLIHAVSKQPYPEGFADGVQESARRRISAEAQEGLSAFIEKRKPAWA